MWHGKVLEFMNPLDVGATSAWVVLGTDAVTDRVSLALHWTVWKSMITVDRGASLSELVEHACTRRRIPFRLFFQVVRGIEALLRGSSACSTPRVVLLGHLCDVVKERGGSAAVRDLLPQLQRAHRNA